MKVSHNLFDEFPIKLYDHMQAKKGVEKVFLADVEIDEVTLVVISIQSYMCF